MWKRDEGEEKKKKKKRKRGKGKKEEKMDRGVGENLCESALAPPRAPELLFVRTRDRASKNLRIAEAPSSLPDRTVIRPIHPSCRRSFPFYLDVRLIPSLVSLSPSLFSVRNHGVAEPQLRLAGHAIRPPECGPLAVVPTPTL